MLGLSKLFTLLLVLRAAAGSALPEDQNLQTRGNYGYPRTVHVSSGQSIQKAINHASPGSTIIVEHGTYPGPITIRKDGINLIGKGGAKIVPPSDGKYDTNPCSGFTGPNSQAGICVAGRGIKADAFKNEHRKIKSVKYPVKGVSISGFTVENFAGANILVIGALDTTIRDNNLVNNLPQGAGGQYGFLMAGSTNTQVRDNEITSDPFSPGVIGLCMDGFHPATAEGNKISHFVIGLCVQTQGAMIQHNQVMDACFGAYLDPGVKDAKVKGNEILKSAQYCGSIGLPQAGIALGGSIHATVANNYVTEQSSPGGESAGIWVLDDPCTEPKSLACLYYPGGGAAKSKYNVVKGNKLDKNTLDIKVTSKGKGNVIKRNDCQTSDPAGYCRGK